VSVAPILGSILVSVAVKLGVKLFATAVKGIVDATGSTKRAPGADSAAFPALLKERAREMAGAAGPAVAAASATVQPHAAPVAPLDLVSRLAFAGGVRGLALAAQSRPLIEAYRRLGPTVG
jgi:hypothetical protein